MPPLPVPRRPEIAIPILVIGAGVYALLCLPAIQRRGYPPIDHVWIGVTYLWIGPVALSALFDGGKFASRRNSLFAYAAFTGFIDAGTIGLIVPRHVDLLGTLIMTVLFSGPLHIVITIAIERGMQFVLGRHRVFQPVGTTSSPFRLSMFEYFVGYSIVAATIGSPFVYRHWTVARERQHGIDRADEDWARQEVRLFSDYDAHPEKQIRGATVWYRVDPATGFTLDSFPRHNQSTTTYNQRIAELVRQNGLPDGSPKSSLVTPDQLVELLDSSQGVELTTFPHEVAPSILVFRSGTISRWGYTMSFDGTTSVVSSQGSHSTLTNGAVEYLAIATQRGDLTTVGRSHEPVFVITLANKALCIRYGSQWIGLFHHDGSLLATATR